MELGYTLACHAEQRLQWRGELPLLEDWPAGERTGGPDMIIDSGSEVAG